MPVIVIDKGWNAMIARMYGCSGYSSKVGYPVEKLEQHKKGVLNTMQIAAVHEFGAPNRNIPMRAHVRTAYDENRKKIKDRSIQYLGKVVDGSMTPEQAISVLGEKHTNDIKLKIKKGPFKALAPSTIARRKEHSTRPLVDSAQMIQSVTHVENKR